MSDGETQGWGRRMKKRLVWATALVLAAVAVVAIPNVMVERAARGRCYGSVDAVPQRRVGLLLGCAQRLRDGRPNPYFDRRVAACVELYHAGKISKVLVSGDNSRADYNEPADMRRALMAAGVADSDIVLDYAGFRTYDSMVRAQRVFGQSQLTVVSQEWHNERALYIADRIGLDAVAYNAADVDLRRAGQTVREWLARAKMAFDLLFPHDPHFLGDPVAI